MFFGESTELLNLFRTFVETNIGENERHEAAYPTLER